ncbi:acetylornithine deacetylase [Marinosulfonomonas sp. PRT-SC04]|nr:acetylornithine deacetylase [Marinosulfonomonas sp. PRT-SC04]
MTQALDILEKLIGFRSISANSNLDIIDYIEHFLTARSFTTHRIYDPTGTKAGLFARLGPAGHGILLSGHTDVVPVAGQDWYKAPFKLSQQDARVYGRGTTDMKGYLASMLALADRASHTKLSEPLKLSFSYDEEIGCVGIQHMIGQLNKTIGLPRACFVGEPTEMQVAIGHKGKAALRATCHGQSGHSALAPQFLNALHLATDFVTALRGLQQDLAENGAQDPAYNIPYSTVHVGKLTGGIALNIVPDNAVVDFEYRHLAADNPTDLLARIQVAAREVEARYPAARIIIDQYNAYPGLDVDEGSEIVTLAKKLAQTNTVTKVAFGTEAGYFNALGIPTIVCGPGSMQGQGHKPDEYISLAQLAACDAMMDKVLDELRG